MAIHRPHPERIPMALPFLGAKHWICSVRVVRSLGFPNEKQGFGQKPAPKNGRAIPIAYEQMRTLVVHVLSGINGGS
jgi:hypothetical protein